MMEWKELRAGRGGRERVAAPVGVGGSWKTGGFLIEIHHRGSIQQEGVLRSFIIFWKKLEDWWENIILGDSSGVVTLIVKKEKKIVAVLLEDTIEWTAEFHFNLSPIAVSSISISLPVSVLLPLHFLVLPFR